jgi:hypothetical protein
MRFNEFLPPTKKALRDVRNATARASVLLSAFLGLSLLLIAGSSGCAPKYAPGDGNAPASGAPPELTDEVIRERINDTGVWDVPEETGTAEPISWRFDEDEPKEIAVVEKKIEGTSATIVLDIKTRSALNRRNPRALAGQIRTDWQLKTGWALRRWEIVNTQNISMKYKNLPKPPAENSNR